LGASEEAALAVVALVVFAVVALTQTVLPASEEAGLMPGYSAIVTSELSEMATEQDCVMKRIVPRLRGAFRVTIGEPGRATTQVGSGIPQEYLAISWTGFSACPPKLGWITLRLGDLQGGA
jgi:hypothetical protein